MYKLTVEDLRMDWDGLKVKEVHQANSIFNASECYLDDLTIEQLQFLVDKHGHKVVIDRLSGNDRLDEGSN